MRAFLSLAAAGMSLLLVPAAVTAANEPTAAKNGQAKADPNRQICRRIRETGSLARSTRVCHTQAEWDLLAERSRNESMSGAMTGGTNNN